MVSPRRQALRETANGTEQLVRVPKAAELVAADLRRQIIAASSPRETPCRRNRI